MLRTLGGWAHAVGTVSLCSEEPQWGGGVGFPEGDMNMICRDTNFFTLSIY